MFKMVSKRFCLLQFLRRCIVQSEFVIRPNCTYLKKCFDKKDHILVQFCIVSRVLTVFLQSGVAQPQSADTVCH